MKTFSIVVTNPVSEYIEKAAAANRQQPAHWLLALALREAQEAHKQAALAAVRARPRIITFPIKATATGVVV